MIEDDYIMERGFYRKNGRDVFIYEVVGNNEPTAVDSHYWNVGPTLGTFTLYSGNESIILRYDDAIIVQEKLSKFIETFEKKRKEEKRGGSK